MKILFLDIDGVLNSTRSCVGLGYIPHDVKPKDLPYFDQVALGLVRNLCTETGAQIFLSSSWRILHDVKHLGVALDIPIIDKTPVLNTIRGKEIAAWLSDRNDVQRYAIVDDDSDMLPEQAPHFVQTNCEDGLLWGHYKRLMELL